MFGNCTSQNCQMSYRACGVALASCGQTLFCWKNTSYSCCGKIDWPIFYTYMVQLNVPLQTQKVNKSYNLGYLTPWCQELHLYDHPKDLCWHFRDNLCFICAVDILRSAIAANFIMHSFWPVSVVCDYPESDLNSVCVSLIIYISGETVK